MEKTKLKFHEQILYAVTRPMQYYRLTNVSGGRLTGFIFLFIFVTSLFTIIPVTYSIVGPNGVSKYLKEELPDFELKNGELNVDGRFEEDDGNSYILIDTSIEKFTPEDISQIYNQVILISKTNIVNHQLGRTQIINFADFKSLHFDKRIVQVIMPFIYVLLILVAIIMYLSMVFGYLFSALLYSLVGLIVNAISHISLKYAAIFKTAIYSKVTISLIFAVLNVTPLVVPNSIRTGLSILITCTYIVYGTMSHNTDAAREAAGIAPPPNDFYGR